MPDVPTRSPGVLLSGSTAALAQDLVAEQLHRLNHTAWLLLARCDGRTTTDELVRDLADGRPEAPADIEPDILAALDAFRALGLIDRTIPPPAPRRLGQADEIHRFPHHGVVHPVGGHRVRFCGVDPDLVALADDTLGPGAPDGAPTRSFAVVENDDGSVSLHADSEWRFAGRLQFIDQLTNAVNEYSYEASDVTSLHAAGLVSPSGRVVVLPARSGAGKSTLTGQLIIDGWDYLGDEAVGIRTGDLAAVPYPKPLALDRTSRSVLGLAESERWNAPPADLSDDVRVHVTPPGPIDLIALPTFHPGADLTAERLDASDALAQLIANALNLPAALQAGMDVLDQVATTIPVWQVTYGDGRAASDWLADRTAERF